MLHCRSKRWFFEKPYKVTIGERSEWKGGSHELTKQGLIWFMNGSKAEKSVRATAWREGSGHEVIRSLDIHATVFQAEVRAIEDNAQAMLEGDCRRNLVSHQWIPGHSGVIGNEKADKLGNRDARAVKSTRCSVGLPACYLDELLEKWFGKKELKRWQEKKGLRQAKLLIGEHPREAWLVELRKFNRRQLRLAVGRLTEHWRVNYHLPKMGLSHPADCRWCHVEEETTEHLLCECQAWAVLWQKVVGSLYLEAGQLRELNFGSITLLAERINRKLG